MSDVTKVIEELQAQMRQLIEAQTFSAQAVEGIAKLREENATLKASVKIDLATIESLRSQLTTAKTELHEANAKLSTIDAAKKVLDLRESKVGEHEKGVAVSMAVTTAYRECLGLVFRNVEIRRSFIGDMPAAGNANPNTYNPPTVPVTQNTTETHT